MADNFTHLIISINLSNLKSVTRDYAYSKTVIKYVSGDPEEYVLTRDQHNLLIAKIKEQNEGLAAKYQENPENRKLLSTTFHFYLDGAVSDAG